MESRQKRKKSGQFESNLKRFKNDVNLLTKEKEGSRGDSEQSQISSVPITMTRKERRKEERKLKKMRRNAFYQHLPMPNTETLQAEKLAKLKGEKKKKKLREKRKRKRLRKLEEKREQEKGEELKAQDLREANKMDNRVIKELEKELFIKKRKSKTKKLPQGFINDGLDYLLDIVDPEKLKTVFEEGGEDLSGMTLSDEEEVDDLSNAGDSDEEDFDDASEENDTDNEELTSESKKNSIHFKDMQENNEKVKSSTVDVNDPEETDEDFDENETEEDSESSELNTESLEDSKAEEFESDDELANVVESDSEEDGSDTAESGHPGKAAEGKKGTRAKSSLLTEDIYGRLRDKQGNVVKSDMKEFGGYIPPAKRLALAQSTDEKKRLELERIKKQVKGLLNRLSEANLQSISNQVEEMFRQTSRAYLSETLTSQILEGCVTPTPVPERLIMEQVALMAIIHINIGSEIGATFLQEAAKKFQELLAKSPQYGESKEMNNLLVVLSHLYNFKVIQSPLIFDIFQRFIEAFGERDIELLLLLFKNVGFGLRKDDPEKLKDVLLQVKDKASAVDTSNIEDKSRVKFMLEVMLAIRNNNMRKIPNYDQSPMEHLRKLIRQYASGGSSVDYQLRISLNDLLSSEEKGRWWLVGSAWSGVDSSKAAERPYSATPISTPAVSQKILNLAVKQRMNTDIRKHIFCILMSSEDYVDAFEKLLKLGLKSSPEKEIVHVVMDLCMQENPFNAFYAYLAQKFCEYNRRFQMTVQFFTWDKMQILHETQDSHILNLAKFLTHLISKGAISLSIFKNIQFSELDKGVLLLMRTVLTSLLMDFDDRTVLEVFSRVGRLSKLKAYQDGLKIFMQHFIMRNKGKGVINSDLKLRIEMAEKALNTSEASFKL